MVFAMMPQFTVVAIAAIGEYALRKRAFGASHLMLILLHICLPFCSHAAITLIFANQRQEGFG